MNEDTKPLTPEERHALAIAPFRFEIIHSRYGTTHVSNPPRRYAADVGEIAWRETRNNGWTPKRK